MDDNKSIQRISDNLPAPMQETNILQMMRDVIARPNATDAAGALEQLVKLKEHVEDRDARKEYFQAFARVQKKLQTIVATMVVPDARGNTRWMVAPIQDIQDAIKPVLQEEGFSVRFDSERSGNIITGICYAMHDAGHQECAKSFIDATKAQGGDVGAHTTAKRVALTEMFGLVIRRGDDARVLGDFIDPDEVDELKKSIAAAGNVPMPQFLQYAGGAKKLEDIRKGKLPQLRAWLRKRTGGKPATETPTETAQRPTDAPPVMVSSDWCMKFRSRLQKKRANYSMGDEDFLAKVCGGPLEELTQVQADKLAADLGAGAFDWEDGCRLPENIQ